MNKFVKSLTLAAVAAVGITSFASAYTTNEQAAIDTALSRVPGATYANITEFERDYDNGRLEYEGEIRYNGYEYDFEIDAQTGTITKWEVERAN